MNKKWFLKKNLDAIVVFCLMFCIFFFVVFFAESDMSDHAYYARSMLKEGKLFSGNFLMYLLVNLFSGFTGTIHLTKAALAVLLSLSNTAKYIIVKKAIEQWGVGKYAKMASLALLLVFVVPILYFLQFLGWFSDSDTMYLGYCVPNVWHNSTILCMMPFAILTYLLSVKQFEDYDKTRNGLIVLFVVIGVMIKPSFFFVYAVAYPILMFTKYGLRRDFFFSLIPILCGCVCVLYQYITIYTSSVAADAVSENSSSVVIEIMPLFTVGFWKSRWLKLMVSMIMPIAFLAAYWKEIIKNREFWFVFVMLVVALGISWCCHETGPRASHGNFAWQVISSMWFVYFYMLKTIVIHDTIADGNRMRLNKRGMVFMSLYSLHVVTGVFYLVRYILTKSYC